MIDRKNTTPTPYLVAPPKEATTSDATNDSDAKSESNFLHPEAKRNESIQHKTHWLRMIIAFALHLTVILFLLFYSFFLVYFIVSIFCQGIQMPNKMSDLINLVTITFPFVLLAATLITFNFRVRDFFNNVAANSN